MVSSQLTKNIKSSVTSKPTIQTTSSGILSDFINAITSFDIIIPIWLQIGIIIVVMIALTVGAYAIRDTFEIGNMRGGLMWFVFVAMINLISIFVIFVYYGKKNNTYVGIQGPSGKKGKSGKEGKYVSCTFDCKNNIYIQRIRHSDVICNVYDILNIYNDTTTYFTKLISNNNIIWDDFVNSIILGKTVKSTDSKTINDFRKLMLTPIIAGYLIKAINHAVTRASNDVFGTFRNPNGKVGYISIGDAVYGGIETFELNSFVINGNVLHPSTYIPLISFTIKSNNTDTDDSINSSTEEYTIWRPIGQTITDNSGFKGASKTSKYNGLGDICRYGTSTSKPPNLNEVATINESCLDVLDPNELTLVFVYIGESKYNNSSNSNNSSNPNNIDYTQSNSYLIQQQAASNDIDIFSVWRTPLNTFITNCDKTNDLINNSLYYNITNGLASELNDYGNVSSNAKLAISSAFADIELPKILIATIICKHYEIEFYKEIVYYFNKYQSKVPEFNGYQPQKNSFGDIMNLIELINTQYDDYNNELVKNANAITTITSPNSKITKKITKQYDASQEKHLPTTLLTIYNSINTKLLTISIQITNTNTLLDIINIIFDNGLDGRVAVDAAGIAEGGTFFNDIQESVLRICKIIRPPSQVAYTIKDECLGIFSIDHGREADIKKLTTAIGKYKQLFDDIASNNDKYGPIVPNIRQYDDVLNSKIGQVCGHIKDYKSKLDDTNLEEFTTSRITQLVKLYTDMNKYLKSVMSKV